MNSWTSTVRRKIQKSLILCFFVAYSFGSFGPTNRPVGTSTTTAEPTFKLSDDELKMLNLGEKETQEIQQFFDALNNLTPEQKRELEELGRQTEESMRKKNLDPSNFEDLVKFMEEEGLAPQQPQQAPFPQPTSPMGGPSKPEPIGPQLPLPVEKPISVVEARNAEALLNDIIKHLNSFKHKASLQSSYKNKLKPISNELIEFSYYLEVLKQTDLLALLGTAEFNRLYQSLEALRKELIAHEPSIKMASSSSEEDNPYEVLDIPYNSTAEDIEKAYQALKISFDPTLIEERLKKEGADAKAIKKEIKTTNLFFSFINEAYTTLKDPKQKAFVDRTLRHKREQDRQQTSLSSRSFERVMNALTSAFRSNMVLQSIKQLIEKNKPQELLIARAEIEKEQKALERSKVPVKVPQLPPSPNGTGGDKYAEFYQKMAMESYQRAPMYTPPYSGGGYQGYQTPSSSQRGANGGSQPSQGGPKEDKKAGKSSAEGKAESKKEKKEEAKGAKEESQGKEKGKKSEETFSKTDVERYLATQSIQTILEDDTKLLVTLETPIKPEPREGEEEEERPAQPAALPSFLTELEKELTSHIEFKGAKDKNPAHLMIVLADQLKIARLRKNFEAILPKKDVRLEDASFKKEWIDNVAKPYGKTISKLNDIFYKFLSNEERNNSKPPKDRINPDKAKQYNLIEQPKGAKPPHKGANLGALRDDMRFIAESFVNIEKILSSTLPKKRN